MKSYLKYILPLLFVFGLKAQTNLVPNGSFEQTTSCPNNFSQIGNALPWTNSNQGTSDLFSTCATSTFIGVPNNSFGSELPQNGNNYAGIGCLFSLTGMGLSVNEYIQVQFSQPLLNKSYHLSFYVSLADSSEYYTGSIGAYFSDNLLNYNHPYNINVVPQLISGGPLNDSSDWQRIEGYYSADGGENFLSLGYFRANSDPIDTAKFQDIPSGGWMDTMFYYYIDNVELIDSIEFTTINEIDNFKSIASKNYFINHEKISEVIRDWREKFKDGSIELFDMRGASILKESLFDLSCFKMENFNEPTFIYLIRNEKYLQRGIITIY